MSDIELRETFAAAALTGLAVVWTARETHAQLAVSAYAMADAMLAERAKHISRDMQPEQNAPVAQQEEQPICDRPVAGSIPAGGCVKTSAEKTLGSGFVTPDHDAVPAARANEGAADHAASLNRDSVGTDKAEPLTRDGGTGNTTEPVAWAVMADGERMYVSAIKLFCEEQAYYYRFSAEVVPLYAAPQDRVVRLPRVPNELASGYGFKAVWESAIMHITSEMDAAGVKWEVASE